MPLKFKILLLALIPMMLVTAAVTWIGLNQARQLSEDEIRLFEEHLLASKKRELKNYVSLAMTSIGHIVDNAGADDEQAQAEVRKILTDMTFGQDKDGYFFVYTLDGTNLVHPTEPELIGQNLYDLQDSGGDYVIRNLLAQVELGGGYHRYIWRKPSRQEQIDKLSYVVLLPKWNWMLGTGLYLDDISREVAKIRAQVNRNIRNTFFTVLVITSVAVVLVVLVGIAVNLHESRMADSRLRMLAHRSVLANVADRRRFSRELHDGINQLMVSVLYRIELAKRKLKNEDPSGLEDLDQGYDVLNEAIQEVRRISHDLRPTLLDDLGLKAALDGLLSRFEERTGIRLKVDIRLPTAELPEDVEITIYRLVQEGLTNVERHADASMLKLSLWGQAGTLWLRLQDNGCGFDTDVLERFEGIGLRNMRERVELLGGEFRLLSKPGQGATLLVGLSLRQRA
ncbi:cache domain-containing protein [Marinobacterium sediminicola]|uniref:histidine kinase n=1 Tax=Marinobacterium sediminicola TaxID=518898 RepID=A0ABY1RVU6_9GAMM|nr:cache domain-containing protein [Marinobacterium sediminicola]ULG70532.1 cache domain-containing protein [Marinobacterium sediminicola]SMR69086.1 two-component system, NarL family, sensor kinase [Marinobacterium sediminicola]